MTAQQINKTETKSFDESQRFKGKTFFLDLFGYKRVKIIEEELILRGASVETFLCKNVRYLVTNRPKEEIHKAMAASRVTSSQSPHTPSTGGTSQLLSPYSSHSSSSLSDKRTTHIKPYFTRGQRMVHMSLEKKKTSTDILAAALDWNCKILHIDSVERELRKLKPIKRPATSKNDKVVASVTVRKLRKPFYKVEDILRKYRPIIYEPHVWPFPNSNCASDEGPFDYLLPSKDRQSTTPTKEFVHEKRGGVCENCGIRFNDWDKHFKSVQHQEYVNNPKNFESLDKYISESHLSLDDFLCSLST